MKKTLLLLVLLCSLSLSAMAQTKWVDATTLNICGHTLRNAENPYSRFDSKPFGYTNKIMIRYATYSTGMYVMFKTNSSKVAVNWVNTHTKVRDNITGIAQLGVDLYVKEGKNWRFCQVGRLSTKPGAHEHKWTIVRNMEKTEKEFMLYLPLWSEVKSLHIGVDEDATIEAIPSPYKHRVVTYGSSTMHGASPSRPGMAMLSRMSRHLGIEFTNFCFSGQCKMDPESASVLEQVETDAILCYCFGNPSVKQIDERVDNWAARLVKAHPGKPIIFLRLFHEADRQYDMKKRNRHIQKTELINRKMKAITKQYKDVYYLSVDYAFGTDWEDTIDMSHPNDLGFDRLLKSYEPKIAKVLKKYGIKPNKK